MNSFIFRFILGCLSLAGAARVGKVFKQPAAERDKRLVNFFGFFFFLALHQFAWSIPFTLFANSEQVAFWSYELAIAFYFLLLYFSLKTLSFIFPGNRFLNNNILGGLALLTGAGVVALQFLLFNLPTIERGFVIWQTDIYTSLINGMFGFLAAILWVAMWYKDRPQTNKVKTTLLSFGALLLGFSCLVFFIFKTPIASVITFSLIFVGLFCALLSFYWPKK